MRVVGAWVAALMVLGLAGVQAEESVALSAPRRCGQALCYCAGGQPGGGEGAREGGSSMGRTMAQGAAAPPPVAAVAPCGNDATVQRAEERAFKPKDSFRECDPGCPEMVVVPAGSFTMGSPAGEEDRNEDEGPEHRVTIAQPFAVGRFAVTFEEWDACAADGGCGGYMPEDAGFGRGRRPVINVSWNDAKAYVLWLSKKTRREYRLLSEAEREYVTRAGTTTRFWWGSQISPELANYAGNDTSDGRRHGQDREKTVAVDSFEPNPFGLHQVHGNVFEWVEDCDHDSYSGAPADGSAWTTWATGDCASRMLRGGSWDLNQTYLRAAYRGRASAASRDQVFGFRVARTIGR
ncbi:MAG: formylglycine-generating enzyme family protein [Alphaproteobacteria bacterium]|nr:formylglycine-generating enzyme family protein [Alphaproteobacteria bacterium]